MIEPTTELCLLGLKYGADKSPLVFHSYTPFYYALWSEKRLAIKRLFELGINAGASHRMWQEFFPNAEIIGADFKENLLINEGRIKSYLCDQSSEADLLKLTSEIGKDFDIMIDDGSHETAHQILTAKILSPLLAKGGIYVIEDVHEHEKILKEFPKADHFKFKDLPGEQNDDKLILIYG